MGIKRLYSYLRYAFEKASMKDIKNTRVGIDAMCWLYKLHFGNNNNDQESQIYIIRKIESLVKILKDNKISFIFVIDGQNLPCKKQEHDRRN